jgi:hypothetical protein
VVRVVQHLKFRKHPPEVPGRPVAGEVPERILG